MSIYLEHFHNQWYFFTMPRDSYVSTYHTLKNRQCIPMTRNPSLTIRWTARNKERPSALLPTGPRQFLQVKHLPQRHAPQREDILVQHVLFMTRPSFESWGVAGDRGEVAVMEPVDHSFGLGDASPALPVVFAEGVWAQGGSGADGGGEGGVGGDEAGADEEEIADLNVTTLRDWADVNSLGFTAGLQLFE